MRVVESTEGASHSRSGTETRASENLGGGYKAPYSQYRENISPSQTTAYYFTSGKAQSPTTTVAVK